MMILSGQLEPAQSQKKEMDRYHLYDRKTYSLFRFFTTSISGFCSGSLCDVLSERLVIFFCQF